LDEDSGSSVIIHTRGYLVDDKRVKFYADLLLFLLKLSSYRFNVVFLTSEEIQVYNGKYRGKNEPTDVLSFPQVGGANYLLKKHLHPSKIQLGDVLVSLDTAKKNAYCNKHTLEREVCFLIIHGLLHLIGYNHRDKQEEAGMFAKQRSLLQKLAYHDNLSPCWLRTIEEKSALK